LAEKDHQLFGAKLLAGFPTGGLSMAWNQVINREAKSRVEPDVTRLNPRFFLKLAQGALHFRLARVEMAFGQVPAIGVAHQEKGKLWLPAKQQDPAGLDWLHLFLSEFHCHYQFALKKRPG
jgi:hypothetical protein